MIFWSTTFPIIMVIVYITIAIYDKIKHRRNDKYLFTYLGLSLCFLLYLAKLPFTGLIIGMISIFYQMHLDAKDTNGRIYKLTHKK